MTMTKSIKFLRISGRHRVLCGSFLAIACFLLLMPSTHAAVLVQDCHRWPLHCAASLGETNTVANLVSFGFDVNELDQSSYTPLYYAVLNKHVETAAKLVELKAKPDLANVGSNFKLLHWTITNQENALAEILLKGGADPNLVSYYDGAPLHVAAQKHNTDAIKLLVTYGAKVDLLDQNGATALHTATFLAYVDVMTALVESHANLNLLDKDRLTPLLIAVKVKQLEPMQMLAKAGANLEIPDATGMYALHLLVAAARDDMLAALIESGPKLDKKNQQMLTPLLMATNTGRLPTIQILVKAGANLDIADPSDATPLILAIKMKSLEIGTLLVKAGANLDAPLAKVRPLHHAVTTSQLDFIHLLIQNHATVNVEDSQNQTPLSLIWPKEDTTIIDVLLNAGATMFADGNHTRSLLHYAAETRSITFLDWLLTARGLSGEINNLDSASHSPLSAAIAKLRPVVAKFLIEHGANLDVGNGKAIAAAILVQDTDTLRYLLEKGAALLPQHKTLALDSDNATIVAELAKYKIDFNDGDSLLRTIFDSCNPHAALQLIQLGVDVNKADKRGNLATVAAVQKRCNGVFDSLIKAGADINAIDKADTTALLWAISSQDLSWVQAVVGAGADVNKANGGGLKPIVSAWNWLQGKCDHADIFAFLWSRGAADFPDAKANTAAHQFVANTVLFGNEKCLAIADAMAERPGFLDVRNAAGDLPLHAAAASAPQKAFKNFLSFAKGTAQRDQPNSNGETALQLLCESPDSEFVNAMFTAGANSTATGTGKYDLQPFHMCLKSTVDRYDIIAGWLQFANIDPNLADRDGSRPLHAAATRGNTRVVVSLCRAGADINAKNNAGETPSDIAKTNHLRWTENILKICKNASEPLSTLPSDRLGDWPYRIQPMSVAINSGKLLAVQGCLDRKVWVGARASDGSMSWARYVNSSANTRLSCDNVPYAPPAVEETADGRIVVNMGEDFFAYDANGLNVWQARLPGNDNYKLSDGLLAEIPFTATNEKRLLAFHLVRGIASTMRVSVLDSQGKVESQRDIDLGVPAKSLTKVKKAEDGGLLFITNGTQHQDSYVTKLDRTLSILWTLKYDDSYLELSDVIDDKNTQTVYVLGSEYAYNSNMPISLFIEARRASGEKLWTQDYTDDIEIRQIVSGSFTRVGTGDFIATGVISPRTTNAQGVIYRINGASGKIAWRVYDASIGLHVRKLEGPLYVTSSKDSNEALAFDEKGKLVWRK